MFSTTLLFLLLYQEEPDRSKTQGSTRTLEATQWNLTVRLQQVFHKILCNMKVFTHRTSINRVFRQPIPLPCNTRPTPSGRSIKASRRDTLPQNQQYFAEGICIVGRITMKAPRRYSLLQNLQYVVDGASRVSRIRMGASQREILL